MGVRGLIERREQTRHRDTPRDAFTTRLVTPARQVTKGVQGIRGTFPYRLKKSEVSGYCEGGRVK